VLTLSQSLAFSPLSYTEEELTSIYEDVLAVPVPQSAEPDMRAAQRAIMKAQADEDLKVIEALEERLLDDTQTPGSPYRRILNRAHEIVTRAEAARTAVNPDADSRRLPMGVLSVRECEALIRASVRVISLLLTPCSDLYFS